MRFSTTLSALALAASGCAVHRVGVLESGTPPVLVSIDGGRERLVLVGEQLRLGELDQHLVEVDGRHTLRKLVVTGYRPLEGPSGMPVVYGPIQVDGSKVAVVDVVSGGLVWVDEAAAEALRAYLGAWVAIEGVIDGPQTLMVLHWTFAEPREALPDGGR